MGCLAQGTKALAALHGEEELAVKPRKDTSPITRLYVRGMKTHR